MFNFHKLLSPAYLFSVSSTYLERSDKLLFIIGALFIIFAIVFKIAALYAPNPVDTILRNKFYFMFLTIGISEVVWFGLRFENVKFFGSHFVALVILFIGLLWFLKLVWSIIRNYKGDKQLWEKEQVKLKYLPK